MIFALGSIALVTAMAVPQTLAGLDSARGEAGARYLASRMALARALAVSRSTTVALRFEEGPADVRFAVYADGNRNGVKTADITAGVDRRIEAPVQLSDLFAGVVIGLAPDTPAAAPVQLGLTTILSFTPAGTATSGTIHVVGRDGTQWGVRVLGATGRTRVLRYDTGSKQWVEAF